MCLPDCKKTRFHLGRGECHYLSMKRLSSCFWVRKKFFTKLKNGGLLDRGAAEATGCAEHGLLLKERVAARAGCAKHEVDSATTCQGPKAMTMKVR